MTRPVYPGILAIVLLATACTTEQPGVAPPSTTTTTTTATPITESSMTTDPTNTTVAATTTVTTIPAEVDLINPMEGTLAGTPVGTGPVEPVLEALEAAYGPPDRDSGWGPNECLGGSTTRSVVWESLGVYMEEADGAQVLFGYEFEVDPGSATDALEEIELPDGIALGMTYGAAADLYPDDVYTHESLELDSIYFPAPPTLSVVAQASPDRSTPITEVWVGSIPTCS